MQEPFVLLHLHLPKTGGKTVRFVLSRQYDHKSIYHVNSPVDLPDASADIWGKIWCLGGHFVYGAHERLQGRPYRYITMLRDPIERVISTYYFMLRSEIHRDHQTLIDSGYSLREWVENGVGETYAGTNKQTTFLAGVFPGPVTTYDQYEVACHNLENGISAVGLTEQFDRSMLLYQKMLGWPNVLYSARNVAAGRLGRSQIDADTIRVIESHNQLDIALYEIARERFERDARSIGRAVVFSYRLMNQAYGAAASVRDRLRKSKKSASMSQP